MLMIDIGNHCLKWAFYDAGQLGPQQRIPYHQEILYTTLTQQWSTHQKCQTVYVANVAGAQIAEILKQWVADQWQLTPVFMTTPRYACGVSNGYQWPEQLGIDRWLALVGAYHLVQDALIVVDCGTAITLDKLTKAGQHEGGLIMPGIAMMQQSLLQGTATLATLIQSSQASQCALFDQQLARNTEEGIQLGTLYAVLGLLEYIKMTQKEALAVILTGGDIPRLLPFLSKPYQYIPDLVLRGLVTVVSERL
jgi:type III pantothenate kinase